MKWNLYETYINQSVIMFTVKKQDNKNYDFCMFFISSGHLKFVLTLQRDLINIFICMPYRICISGHHHDKWLMTFYFKDMWSATLNICVCQRFNAKEMKRINYSKSYVKLKKGKITKFGSLRNPKMKTIQHQSCFIFKFMDVFWMCMFM